MGIPAEFPAAHQIRTRRRCSQFAYEGRDDPTVNPDDKFRIEIYYFVLDVATNALDERFESLHYVEMRFGFLYYINDAGFQPSQEQCKLLEETLRDPATNTSDISGSDLLDEISVYLSTRSDEMKGTSVRSLIDFLNLLGSKGITELFSNLVNALRVLCTIPVGVASAERSFSKQKLIKSYLRKNMCDERLSRLALISIHFNIWVYFLWVLMGLNFVFQRVLNAFLTPVRP